MNIGRTQNIGIKIVRETGIRTQRDTHKHTHTKTGQQWTVARQIDRRTATYSGRETNTQTDR